MQLIFKEFPLYVKVSNNQKAKKKTERKIGESGEFVDTTVITNEKKVGTPKFKKISGNDLLHQTWFLAVTKQVMESFILTALDSKKLNITKYPVTIDYEFGLPNSYGTVKAIWDDVEKKLKYNTYKKYKPWDISNLAFFWIKAIEDAIVKHGIIADDSTLHIDGYSVKLTEVPTIEDRFIKVTINS
jgi:Holliday junction resolvase RusA-like endonuclease